TNAVFAWVDERADESSRFMLKKMKEELGLA
ncbi:sugar phosphate isomerase/epimerase, partial [Bacillus velezensis]|nr:sugar phosphate isomerase/epimerase [Bacillus velezensis]